MKLHDYLNSLDDGVKQVLFTIAGDANFNYFDAVRNRIDANFSLYDDYNDCDYDHCIGVIITDTELTCLATVENDKFVEVQ